MTRTYRAISSSPRSMAGVSLVELMIALVLGLIILAGLATIFANSSRSREDLERSSRQIENGRFAMETLTDDLRLAGFYGELDVKGLIVPGALPDPCSTDPVVWAAAIPVHIQGYDNGNGIPVCIPASRKGGTDVIVIRRAATCEAGVAGCPPTQNTLPFIQTSKCITLPPALPEASFVIGSWGTAAYNLRLRNCATVAGVRQYYVRIYYISTDNGAGTSIPTLTRLDFTGTGWTTTPLVEGIEEFNIEYGIDWHGLTLVDPPDGAPDDYTTDPTTFNALGACVLCANPAYTWANVVTARINLLARNIDATPNYIDGKTYSLGRDAANAEILVTPGGPYRRHAYTGMVRIVNAAERRDVP
jgi:type IV pilus assembly protein PilW